MIDPRTLGTYAAKTALATLLLLPTGSLAQDGSALSGSALKIAAEESRKQAKPIIDGGPTTSSTFGTLASAFQIETLAGDETASISLAFNRSHPLDNAHKNADGSTRYTFATDSLAIVASAPLGKNGKPSLFNIDSLSDGSTLEVKATRYWGSLSYFAAADQRGLTQLRTRLENRCIDAKAGEFISDASMESEARATYNALRAELDSLRVAQPDKTPTLALDDLQTSPEAKIAALASLLFKACGSEADNNPDGNLQARFGNAGDLAIAQAMKPGGLWFLGARAKIARTNYEYLTQAPLTKSDVSKTGYRVEAVGGRIFGGGRTSASGSFAYVRKFTPGDETQLCDLNGVGTQLTCLTGSLGAPTQSKSYTVGGEMRFLLKLGEWAGRADVGLAPHITYELKTDAPTFELPIYFAPNKDKALNGGLRLVYTTRGKDDFGFGLFVGVPFSLFFD